MIPIFSGERRGQLLLLLGLGLAELTATMLIARSLHQVHRPGAALVLALATLGAFLLQVLQRRLCEGVGLSYAADVRGSLFRRLMMADPQIIQDRRHGAMLQSFVGDLTALRQWVSEGITRGLLAILALVGMLTWLALAEPRLALWLGGVAVCIAFAGAALLPALTATVRAVRRQRGRVASLASEGLAAQASVQAFGRAAGEAKRLDGRVRRLNRLSLQRAWLTGALRALPHLAGTAMLAILVLAPGDKQGIGLAGGFVVVGIFSLALRDLARAGELMIPGRVATARVASLLRTPVRSRPRRHRKDVAGETGLIIDRLHFAPGAPRLTVSAAPGDVILLDGEPDLLRKLLRVLAGRCSAGGGVVRWDGSDLLAASPSELRSFVGVMSPELPLVSGSAGRNIRYRAAQLTDAQVAALAAPWKVNPASRRFDAQSVALLRALAGSPPILLLDLSETALPDDAVARLEHLLREHHGVVLLMTGQQALRRHASRVWWISRDGFAERLLRPADALRLVRTIDQQGRA